MNWFKCSERLPEKEGEYLVQTQDDRNQCFCLHVWQKNSNKKAKKSFEWTRCLQESYDFPYECGKVTYWMPITQPGKE